MKLVLARRRAEPSIRSGEEEWRAANRWRSAGRPVRWCGLIKRSRRPRKPDWNRSDGFDQDTGRSVDLVRRLVEDGADQPNDMLHAVIELGSIVVLRRKVVGLEVAVNERV